MKKFLLHIYRILSGFFLKVLLPLLWERTGAIYKYTVRHWFRLSLLAAVAVALISFLMTAGVYLVYKHDEEHIKKELAEFRDILRGESRYAEVRPIQIFARDNTLIGEYIPEKESRINLNSCRQMTWLNASAVSAEDRYFYEHPGVSLRGIARAFVSNLKSLSIREGGGSITQQLGRNLFTDPQAFKLTRKIYETFAAFRIEDEFSKEEILCLYLNKIYMGEGRFGAEEASWLYFRKPPWQLDAAEAAMIVGLFPSPGRYSPLKNIDYAMTKQQAVLNALIRDKKITEPAARKVVKEFTARYEVLNREDVKSPGTIGLYGAKRQYRLNLAPNVNERAVMFLREAVEEERILQGGLKVYTTIDPVRQKLATEVMRRSTENLRNEFVQEAKNRQLAREYRDGLNGVFVSVHPGTGDILAEVGGFSVDDTGAQMDRVRQMRRQPGSSIKGILYAIALDEDVLRKEDVLVDAAVDYNGYKPLNWYKGYMGEISLNTALARSVNTVAVKVLHDLGVNTFLSKLGEMLQLGYFDIKSRFKNNLTLALGSGEMSPLEMARAYGVLLNSGRTVYPRLITKITDDTDNLLWEDYIPMEADNILSASSARTAVLAMKSVLKPGGTVEWIGQKKAADKNYIPFPVAGKTGTVQTDPILKRRFRGFKGVHDVWFAGLVPGEAVIVWFGHDKGVPFPGSGSGITASTWANYASGLENIQGWFFDEEENRELEKNNEVIENLSEESVPLDVIEQIDNSDETGPSSDSEDEEVILPDEGDYEPVMMP